MKRLLFLFVTLLFFPIIGMTQNDDTQNFMSAFDAAYNACPNVPRGLLEAVSFTNTHCYHLTDANYTNHNPNAMPRSYGLMGLVKDGKGYFRENLHLVSELSGIVEDEILQSPAANVLAYAKAFSCLVQKRESREIKDYLSVIWQLSELPVEEDKDVYPMQSMLYSVCLFLNNAQKAEQYGFKKYNIDIDTLFSEHLSLLKAPRLGISRGSDYPLAIWDPAPECNWEPRTKPVSAVVIHYTEGSYAGCISWFKNCDAEVSAHYVIRSSDGQITQMVHEADKAWHALSANGYTIGIEHEAYGNIWSFFTEEMYQSSANLIRDICYRHNINGHRTFYRDTLDNGTCLNYGFHNLGGEEACTKIRGHQHYPNQSHSDPGPYWDWNYYYKLINEGTPITFLEGEEGLLDYQNYGDDERKIWVIVGPEGSTIQLNFSNFSLEADYDFLWIYDGDDVYSPKIGRWNTQSPGVVQSSSNVMCVEFRSDCATTSTGWEASWTALSHTFVESELIENQFVIFPNPTQGIFAVKANTDGPTDLVVIDACGKVMTTARFMDSVEVNASDWAPGVYIVYCDKYNKIGKLIKL